MKLRLLVLALLIANVLALSWHLGWFDGLVGMEARTDREPQRVLQQVHPQSINVVPATAAAPTLRASPSVAAASTPQAPPGTQPNASATPSSSPGASSLIGTVPSCLEAGPFSASDIETAEKSLAGLPASTWQRLTVERAPAYGVVMGPFATPEALRTRAAELERLKQRYERISQPNADGTTSSRAPTVFLLQRVPSREAGNTVLASLAQRGVRTARVMQISPATVVYNLRVENAAPSEMAALRLSGSGIEARPFAGCAP